MKTRLRNILPASLFMLVPICFTSCSSSAINDYFGIEMDPMFADDFKIISYSEFEGAKYQSNSEMNPMVYAYAELMPNTVLIKIVNKDKAEIPINYNIDQYILHTTDERKYILTKGAREEYQTKSTIASQETREIKLGMPADFWKTVGMRKPQSQLEKYTEDFWKGENSLNLIKEEINHIEIKMGISRTLILKPVPGNSFKNPELYQN